MPRGWTEWGIFWRIVLPLSRPVMAVLGNLFFTAAWNNFVWPLVVMTEDSKFPALVATVVK
jgi:fructooligosaccharide transport system permease protein